MAKSKSGSASDASPVPHTLFYVSPFLSASYLQAVSAPDLLPLITELSHLKTREFYDEACKMSIAAQNKLIQAFLGHSKSSVDQEQQTFINQMSDLATKKAREFEHLVREEVKKKQQVDATVAWNTPPWVSPLMPFAPPMWPPPFAYNPSSPPPRAPWSYSWQQSYPTSPVLPEPNPTSKKKTQKESGAGKNADSGNHKPGKEKSNPNNAGGKKKGKDSSYTVRFEDDCTDSDTSDGKGNCLDWIKGKKKGSSKSGHKGSGDSSSSSSDDEDSDSVKKSKKNTSGKGNQQGKNAQDGGRKQQKPGGGGSQPPARQGGHKGGGDKFPPPPSQIGPYSYPPGSGFSFHQGYARWDYRSNAMEIPSSSRYQVWIPPTHSDDKEKERPPKKQKEKPKEDKKKQKEKSKKKEESDSDEDEGTNPSGPAWTNWRRTYGY